MNARDLGNDVVQAFDVLNIDGGEDVNAGAQYLLDIKVTLGMPAALNIGMGKLVDQDQLRLALENGIQIAVVQVAYDSVGVDAPEDVEWVERFLRR